MAITYEEYKSARQKSFNELPVYFAFSDEQFNEVLEKTGASGPEDFYGLGIGGGFFLKKDRELIHAWVNGNCLDELMRDYEFAKGAFRYEMNNHEYFINTYQADWDTMSCFIDIEYKDEGTEGYLARSGWDEQTKQAYRDAKRETYREWCENDWF